MEMIFTQDNLGVTVRTLLLMQPSALKDDGNFSTTSRAS
jgi:hypothetical protein